jgi:hypothetical protein
MSEIAQSIFTENKGSTAVAFHSSPTFNEAVSSSWFVRSIGIAAAAYTIASPLGILGPGLGIGIGLFVLRYGSAIYYRILGIVVVVSAILAFVNPLFQVLGPAVLSGAILAKAAMILRVLSKEGRNSHQWSASRKRAIVGIVFGGIGLGVLILGILLYVVAQVSTQQAQT